MDIVKEHLLNERVAESDIQDLVVTDSYADQHNGVRHSYLRQRVNGIEIFGADIALHQAADGTVLALQHSVVPNTDMAPPASPALSAEQALRKVLIELGLSEKTTASLGMKEGTSTRLFSGAGWTTEDPEVTLYYQQFQDRIALVWNVTVYLPDGTHWWNIRIDANDGRELDRNDWVVECGHDAPGHLPEPAPLAPASPNDYNVLVMPVESPSHGAFSLANAPWNAALNASPYGWHDTDGTPGAEYTITRGNNVYASEDRDNNNSPGYSTDGGPSLDFDNPFDPLSDPLDYEDAAITNLFYWNNIIHDVMYQYGFDEVSGNFQDNNYGNGGAGSDEVNADAQDGSGTNNANFGTPPDGSNPRMQMFRWNYTTPARDSDLDNGIIAHEYGHGISNRLVGGPANANCLGNAEQMGEGWSDYFGLMLTMLPGASGTDARGVGTYVLGQPTTGTGIRPAPYSTDMGVNAYTYASTNSGISQPHGIGFVWCTMLWEMTWDLIGVYGFDADIYNGTGGNNIALQLVMDGLKLTPCGPGFVDGRDAILLADQVNNAGANQDLIWAAFARRGLGFSASQGSASSRSDQVEAFDVPLDVNVGLGAINAPDASLYLECSTDSLTVELIVRNNGLTPQSGFPVSYRLDNGPVFTENFGGTINSGAAEIFTFQTSITLSTFGAHTVTAWTALAGDQDTSNDTLVNVLEYQAGIVLPAPFIEDLETGTLCSTANNCGGTTCSLPNGWINPVNGVVDDIDWRLDTAGTPSSSTGPSVDLIPGTSIGKYIYLEASGTCAQREAMLVSPCLDLSGTILPRLRFGYHMYGNSIGSLHLDVFNGSHWIEDIMTPIVGDQGNQWHTRILYLDTLANDTILLRFRGITGTSFQSDIALDAIEIYEGAVAPEVDFIADPEDWCAGGTVELNDLSLNDPTSWLWTITPGTYQFVDGTSATDENPRVVFNAAGDYSVTLMAANAYGQSSLSRTNYVSMGDDLPAKMMVWTDAWGAETSWMIRILGGDTVLTGGGYPTTQVYTIHPQEPRYTCLVRDTCYVLEVNDSYGDGMCCSYGAGKYLLSAGNGDTLVFGNGQFSFQRLDTFCITNALAQLNADVFLQGAYDAGTGLMRDDLRVAGLLPLIEPYTAAGYPQPNGGGESMDIGVLSTTGPDAIVDWVRIELRSELDPSIVVAAVQALVQRDGDIVDPATLGPVTLPVIGGSYHIAVRHRNHMGCMTSSSVALMGSTNLFFTNPGLVTYGSDARTASGGVMLLWAGNAVPDVVLKYAGSNSDRDGVLTRIGGSVPTNTTVGYWLEDVTLDGVVKYSGPNNDREMILQNIGGSVPTAVRVEQLP